MMQDLGFAIAAACALVSAVAVARSARLVHAVLWLAVTLVATSALYAMLGASFVAALQLLLYVGGVVTLVLFGVMVTRRHGAGGGAGSPSGLPPAGASEPTLVDASSPWPAAATASILFAAMTWAILKDPATSPSGALPPVGAAEVGRALLGDHVMAFETISVLLLAAIVGAIVIARRRDPEAADAPSPAPASRPAPDAGPAPEAAE